jgi:nitronate monooxygenase
MKTVQELFGIEVPLVQAPMAGVQDSTLALAVSAAGGLGSVPCAMLNAEQIEAELLKITAVTSAAVNFNFFCHQPLPYSQQQEKRWLKALSPSMQQYQLTAQDISQGAARNPFSQEVADVLEPHKPQVLSFHFGLPAGDLLKRVKSWGTTVLSSATTVEEAKWLKDNGADVVIAQGLEAGGHRGMFLSDRLTTQSGTFTLLPQIAAAVDVPVIAAGGVNSAAAVKAAMALGATAVQAGTAFLLSDECKTSALHRQALKSDAASHTAITNVFSGRPARSIVNRAVAELGPICPDAMDFPHAATAITALRKCAENAGSSEFSPLWCGQNASGCRESPAAEIVKGLVSEVS